MSALWFWVGAMVVAVCAVGGVIGGTLLKNNWGYWSHSEPIQQARGQSETASQPAQKDERADRQQSTTQDIPIDPNTGKTDLYARTKARVDKSTDYLLKEKITPWLFMFPGSKTTITLHDGHPYSYAGLEFSGSVRDVFWQSFIDPFLEDAIQELLDDVGKECQSNHKNPSKPLDEAAGLLEGMITGVYHSMANVDQRLRGKGYPKNVPRMDVQEQIKRMTKKLKGHLRAAKALYSELQN